MNHLLIRHLVSQPLPRGRFLYRESDTLRFGLFTCKDDQRLWITRRGLSDPRRAAGPFEPHEAVRALRLSNLELPDGCELGPWQDGLGFFAVGPLPGTIAQWTPVEASRLEPSISEYSRDDITGPPDCYCCAPPTYPPKVLWDVASTATRDRLDVALTRIDVRHPILKDARAGSLKRAWNGHPALSLVWAPSGTLERGFYIADFELEGGSDLDGWAPEDGS